MKMIPLALVLGLPQMALSATQPTEITEKLLIKQLMDESPSIEALRSRVGQTQFKQGDFNQQFRWNLTSSVSREKTNEKPLITFAPVFSPNTTLSVGVQKKTQKGLQLKGSVFHNEREFEFGGSPTTRNILGAQFGISMDLYRDLLGQTSKAQLGQIEQQAKQQKIKARIEKSELKISMRRLYWNIVANAEKLRISRELLKSSQKQLKLAERRQRSGIADAGEVALYYSQVSSRESRVSYYQFQEINLYKQLKSLIPALSNKTVSLAKYDMELAVKQVVQCSNHILGMRQIPFESTDYDELISSSEKIYDDQKKLSNLYGKPDVSLDGDLFVKGVDDTYSRAMDDWQDNDRTGYRVALNVTIPLGTKETKGVRAVKKEYERLQYRAFKNEISSKLQAAHMGIQQAIPYLFQSIEAQKKENYYLSKQIKDAKKKYLQGRISATDLTNSQDNFLSTELGIIETKLVILSTLFDYFQYFPKTKCGFNEVLL